MVSKKLSTCPSLYMREDMDQIFQTIYENESDSIFRFCLLRLSDRNQALDITQETFLRLWKSLQDGQKIQNNRAFLFTIARRLIIDWYRKKKSLSLDSIFEREEGEVQNNILDGNTTKEEFFLQSEGRALVDKINELTSSYRDPVYLRFVEGLSPPEVGEIIGISANAASVRINRGLRELKKKAGYND